MTDTASKVSAQGSVKHDEPGDALACFDRDGTAVFASLCRSTAGDRRLAAELLRQTFVQLGQTRDAGVFEPTDRRDLVLAAHREYLADRRADDDFYETSTVPGLAADEPEWVRGRWGVALATLSALTVRERVALNLHLVDGIDLGDIADLLHQPVSAVTAMIDSGRKALLVTGSTETVVEILRHAEKWLGDDERDDVRVALGAVSQRPAPDVAADPGQARRRRRPSKWAALAAVVVGALAAVGVRWLQTLPKDTSTAPVAIDGLAAPVTVSGEGDRKQVIDAQVVKDGTSVKVTPVPGALTPSEVIFMASALTDPEVVVPDAIIKYSDGKVGMSWHGPCNRPAIALAVTNTGSGAVVELTTGGFPVISCVGMPDRWSAVVEPSLPLAEGVIRPVDENGAVVTTFDGYLEAGSPGGTAEPVRDDAGYSSALVDDANQPWVYGVGCSSRSARYQSPIGAIFEIRTETANPDSYSASDAIVCNNLASRAVLAGPRGAIFPHHDADGSSAPVDCKGPVGSQTDVESQLPSNAKLHDGDWSTWDGCVVRNDVIFSEASFETCPGADLRTITFASTLGARISESTETLTFVRDPDKLVAGVRPPLLTYVIAPDDLYDTGLRFGDQQLWLSPRGTDRIYVRVGDEIERWPRLTDTTQADPSPADTIQADPNLRGQVSCA